MVKTTDKVTILIVQGGEVIMKKVVILALIPVVVIVLIVIISKNEKDTVVNMSDSINDLQISTIAPEQLNTLEGISLVHVEYD